MTHANRFVTVRAALLVSVASSSCVLVVPAPNESPSAVCRLTETESAGECGACVEAACQPELDACCTAGSACEPAIAQLVSCKPYESCDAEGTSLQERKLRTCAARVCAAKCWLTPNEDDAAAATGGPVCAQNDDQCSCEVHAGVAASGACKPSSASNVWVCCSSPGYPVDATKCACTPVQCVVSETTCSCSGDTRHRDGDQYVNACSSSSGTCCMRDSSCNCDDERARCPADSVETARCVASSLRCTDSVRVSACTQ